MTFSTTKCFDSFETLLGIIFTLTSTFIYILSIPVFIFRLVVILLAKFFRPDLDEILTGTSALFANDYFQKTKPRSNIVVTMVIQGHVTLEEIKDRVRKNWVEKSITGELPFEKFQQYPGRWCGFVFWKRAAAKFCLDDHVRVVTGRNGESVTEEELNDLVEKLLNARFPVGQSPWQLGVVESYNDQNSHSHQLASVLILKVHHSLGDGFSLLTALLEGLCESSMSNVKIPIARLPQRSPIENIRHVLAAPITGFMSMSYLLSYVVKNPPWRIPDKYKIWYQVCARTEPIPIQVVKDIKNFYGVSFTSVIVSAFSSAIFQSLKEGNRYNKRGKKYGPMLCVSAMPVPGYSQNRKLSNQFTAAVFEIPTATEFIDPVERLVTIDRMMENARQSAIPTLIQYYSEIAGYHFYKVHQILTKNRMVSTALSNFPGTLEKVEFNGKPVVEVDFITGGQQGDAAATFTTFSYNQQIRLGIAVEAALMSRKDAQRFLKTTTDEIQLLSMLMKQS